VRDDRATASSPVVARVEGADADLKDDQQAERGQI